MDIRQDFDSTRFRALTIREAVAKLPQGLDLVYGDLDITQGSKMIRFDDVEDWYNECDKPETSGSSFYVGAGHYNEPRRVTIGVGWFSDSSSRVRVSGAERASLNAVLNVFEEAAPASAVPGPPEPPRPKPRVFIGHGHSPLWRDLKDHLADHHKYDVVVFESGERAGHTVRDVLETMLGESSLALLVLTGEDEQADGARRPRENVVHEVGLFQGRLGFHRSIALVEDGVTPFSNLEGIQQIRFAPGNIKETFGPLLAVLLREFGAGREQR